MPIFETKDLAFRAPSGDAADDTRNAFERTDARIKRLLGGVSDAMGTIESSLGGLQGSVDTVSTGLQDYIDGFSSRFNSAFASSFASAFDTEIASVFTTASNPGFVSVAALTTTASSFVLVGVSDKAPRWQSKADFIKYTIGLEIPTAFTTPSLPASNNYYAWYYLGTPSATVRHDDMYAMASHFDAYVNGLSTAVLDLIAKLKTAKVLS
jgi:hypothetical protein